MIQRNAIAPGLSCPDGEILLLGRETGLAEVARELGLKHLSNIACNESARL